MSVNHRSHTELHTIKAEKLLFYGTNKNATHITIASQDQRALDFEGIDHIEIDDIRVKEITNENTDDTMISFNASNQIDLNNRSLINIATGGISASSIGSENGYTSVDNELDQLWLQKLDLSPGLGANIVLGTNGAGFVVSAGFSTTDVVRLTESQTITNKDLNESDVNISGTRGQVYGSTIGVFGNSTSSQLFYYSPSLTSNSWEYQYLDSDGKIYLKNWDDAAGTTKTDIVIYEPTQVDFKKAIIASDDIHCDEFHGIASGIKMIEFTSNEIYLMEPIVLADNVIRNNLGTNRLVFDDGTYAVKAQVNSGGFAIQNNNTGVGAGNAILHFDSFGTSNCEIQTNDADFLFKRDGATKFSIMFATGARFETDLTTTGTFNSGEITSTGDLNGVNGVFSGDITVGGNDIKMAGGVAVISMTATYTTIERKLRISGEELLDASYDTRLTIGATNAFTGDLTVSGAITGNTTFGSITQEGCLMSVLSKDTHVAELRLHGNGGGTGRIFVGQNSTYGGGIQYAGDNTPSSPIGGADEIVFYRRSADSDTWVMKYGYNENHVQFNSSELSGIDEIAMANNDCQIKMLSNNGNNGFRLLSECDDGASGTTAWSVINNNTSTASFKVNANGDCEAGNDITVGSNIINDNTGTKRIQFEGHTLANVFELTNSYLWLHGGDTQPIFMSGSAIWFGTNDAVAGSSATDATYHDRGYSLYADNNEWLYHYEYGKNSQTASNYKSGGGLASYQFYTYNGNKVHSSDRRLKKDIVKCENDNFKKVNDIFDEIKPSYFWFDASNNYKLRPHQTTDEEWIGVIAQELPEYLQKQNTNPKHPCNLDNGFSKEVKDASGNITYEWTDEEGGVMEVDIQKLTLLNTAKLVETNEKMVKLLKEEQKRNAELEIRLSKMETMCVNIMTKLS